MIERWKAGIRKLKTEVSALYFACRDPRCPWYAKAAAACVVAYALSPIDLIPDPIPILGYLDDLILVPLGIWLAIRLVPRDVMEDCRARIGGGRLPTSRAGAVAIVLIWVIAASAVMFYLRDFFLD